VATVRDELESYLETIEQTIARGGAPSQPAPRPSGFGPLHLAEPGQIPETVILTVAGLPVDFLENLISRRRCARFFERVHTFAARHRERLPRLIRQVGWALVREDPREAPRVLEFLFARGSLEAPGEISLACDLAEEDPTALVPYLPRVLELLRSGDRPDTAEGDHRLSDLLCLSHIPVELLRSGVIPLWESTSDDRVNRILLRLLVYHDAVPLVTYRGSIEERLHRPKTRYQSYSYHLMLGGHDHRVLDLSQELQLNLCELPKYAPSNHLRRFIGKRIEAHGYVERGPTLTFLVHDLHELEAGSDKGRARERS
jgi:hypothetical protein